MSNYPPGLTDNDPHFTDESEEWECNSCGAILNAEAIDCLQGHTRVDDDGHGNPVEVHCGPCTIRG